MLDEVLEKEQISYYPGRVITTKENERILEDSFFDVSRGMVGGGEPGVWLRTFKEHLAGNQSQTMALLNALSEEEFSILLSNSFVVGEEGAESKKNLERLEAVRRQQGTVMVLPVKLVLRLAERKLK